MNWLRSKLVNLMGSYESLVAAHIESLFNSWNFPTDVSVELTNDLLLKLVSIFDSFDTQNKKEINYYFADDVSLIIITISKWWPILLKNQNYFFLCFWIFLKLTQYSSYGDVKSGAKREHFTSFRDELEKEGFLCHIFESSTFPSLLHAFVLDGRETLERVRDILSGIAQEKYHTDSYHVSKPALQRRIAFICFYLSLLKLQNNNDSHYHIIEVWKNFWKQKCIITALYKNVTILSSFKQVWQYLNNENLEMLIILLDFCRNQYNRFNSEFLVNTVLCFSPRVINIAQFGRELNLDKWVKLNYSTIGDYLSWINSMIQLVQGILLYQENINDIDLLGSLLDPIFASILEANKLDYVLKDMENSTKILLTPIIKTTIQSNILKLEYDTFIKLPTTFLGNNKLVITYLMMKELKDPKKYSTIVDQFFTEDTIDFTETRLLLRPVETVFKNKMFKGKEDVEIHAEFLIHCQKYGNLKKFEKSQSEILDILRKILPDLLPPFRIQTLQTRLFAEKLNKLEYHDSKDKFPHLYRLFMEAFVKLTLDKISDSAVSPGAQLKAICAHLKHFTPTNYDRTGIPQSFFIYKLFTHSVSTCIRLLQNNDELCPELVSLFALKQKYPQKYEELLMSYEEELGKLCNFFKRSIPDDLSFEKESKIQSLHRNMPVLKTLQPFLMISVPPTADIVKKFTELKEQLVHANNLYTWLRNRGYEKVVQPIEITPADSPQVHWEQILKDAEDDLGLDKDVVKTMKFFLKEKSLLFEAMTRDRISTTEKERLRLTSKMLTGIVNGTKEFLEKLIDEKKLTLADFDSVYKLMTQFSGGTYTKELSIVSEYFSVSQKYNEQDSHQRIKLMEDAFELLQFYDNIRMAIMCFEMYGIFKVECQQLKSLQASKEEYSKIRISQAPKILVEIRKHFSMEIRSYHLEYFSTAVEVKEVIEFLRQQTKFDDRVKYLSSDLQGYQPGLDLLNNVIAVRNVMKPFLECLEARDRNLPFSIAQLCQAISQCLPREEVVKHQLARAKAVLNQLPEVKLNFAHTTGLTLDTILPYISLLLKNGHYRSRLKLHLLGQKLSLEFEEEVNNLKVTRELTRASLQDLIVGMKVFVNHDTIKSEKSKELDSFLAIYELANNVHDLRLTLEEHGVPEFQGDESNINTGGLIVAQYEQEKNLLKLKLREWKSNVGRLFNENKRLKFLEPRQLAFFLTQFATLSLLPPNSMKNQKHFIYNHLIPFIWSCFPDFVPVNATLTKIIPVDLLEASFINTLIRRNVTNIAKDKNSLTSVFWLECCCLFIRIIEENLENLLEKGSIQQYEERPTHPQIIRAFGCNKSDLFRLVIDQTTRKIPPHPLQLIWCTSKTTEQELERFLEKARCFPNLKFFLIEANRLQIHARKVLLTALSEHFVNEDKNQMSLQIIFTEQIGMEVFNFLDRTDVMDVPLTDAQIKTALSPSKLRELANIVDFEIIQGTHHSGKSYAIKRKLKKLIDDNILPESNVLRVCINEDFTFDAFLEFYKLAVDRQIETDLSKKVVIGVHLNVSAYVPYAALDQLFYNFVFFRVLWDLRSGEVLHLADNLVKWHIFVELSTAPREDAQYVEFSTIEKVVTALPALKYAATINNDYGLPLRPTEGVRLAVAFKKAFENRLFVTQWNLNFSDPSLIQIEHTKAVSMAQNVRDTKPVPPEEVTRLTHDERNFYKLFAKRCRWLVNYAEYICLEAEGGMDVRNSIFPHEFLGCFIHESAHLARGGATTNLKDTKVIYSSRSFTGVSYDLAFLSFNERNQVDQVLSSRLRTEHSYLLDPQQLRVDLAPALGIEGNRMLRSITQQQYVLTPDFAIKLLILNERRALGRNVIFVGGTGLGKTETLDLYSLIVNMDTNLIPDIIFEVLNFLRSDIFQQPQIKTNEKISFLIDDCEERARNNQITTAWIVQLVETICKEQLQTTPVPDAPEDGSLRTFLDFVAVALSKFVKRLTDSYKLIRRTPLIERVLRLPQHDPIQKDVDAIRDLEDLKATLFEVVNAKFIKLFYRILMHAGITAKQLTLEIENIISVAKELEQSCQKPPTIVVFIDEFNTTSVMGLVKEILFDKSLNGRKLQKHVFFVAAMNPYVPVSASSKAKMDYTGVVASTLTLEYAVRPIPRSLDELKIDFGDFDQDQERKFVNVLLDLREELFCPWQLHGTSEKEILRNFILIGQDSIRKCKIDHVKVSIRDVFRFVQLFHYFRNLRPILIADERDKDHLSDFSLEWRGKAFWRAVIMSMCITYYFRLQGETEHRKKFVETVDGELKQYLFSFLDVVYKTTLPNLYKNTVIPPGIACTASLMENLFSIVVCCDAKIPLLIVGPAGSAKTLSFTIAVDNMKGKQSKNEFYQNFHRLHPFRYQCSEFSTDSEIEAIYKSAVDRQQTYEGDDPRNCQERSVVFLDEAGLPKDVEMPLKVIHYHLDHPVVASVILSNKVLDAAKTNRSVLVWQAPQLSPEDLRSLAKGSLFGAIQTTDLEDKIVDALCQGFEMSNTFTLRARKDMYQQRDFIYLLRYLHEHCRDESGHEKFYLKPETLVRGLQRHFNGIPRLEFDKLVCHFFKLVNDVHVCYRQPEWPLPVLRDDTLELLDESLNDRLRPGQSPNVAPFRYILVIDPTDNEAAVSLLLQLHPHRKFRICCVGDFPDDTSDSARSEVVVQVKKAMAAGETVILVNSGPIRTSFYDVFNRHFETIPGDREGEFQYYANVAVASLSKPCVIHNDFKIVVHLPQSDMERTALPFLDRFEKYILSIEQVLDQKVLTRPWRTKRVKHETGVHQVTTFDVLKGGLSDFVDTLHTKVLGGRLLYGLSPRETVCSYLLQILEKTPETAEFPVVTPPFEPTQIGDIIPKDMIELFRDDIDLEFDTSPPKTEELKFRTGNRLQHIIRTGNFALLQLARPESVFNCRLLSKEYVAAYLLRQEHFNVVRFLHQIIKHHYGTVIQAPVVLAQPEEPQDITMTDIQPPPPDAAGSGSPPVSVTSSDKWCVFTRSTGELLHVPTQESMQKWILPEEILVSCPELNNTSLFYFSLSDLSSSEACRHQIETFQTKAMSSTSNTRILLCLADMQYTTANQLNYLRNTIDKYLPPGCLAVMILHFPAELLFAPNSIYQAVYLNGWDYVYIDSFGLTKNSQLLEETTADQLEVDARAWISWAFGFSSASITQESVVNAFRAIFFDLVHHLAHDIPTIHGRKLRLARQFYTLRGQQQKILKGLFTDNPWLYEEVISRFAKTWTNSILHRLVSEVCSELQKGKLFSSFVYVVQTRMQFLLAPMVSQTILNLVSNFSLEPVLRVLVEKGEDGNEILEGGKDLIRRLIVDLAEVPTLKDVLHANAYPLCTPHTQYEEPPGFPMYDVVAANLMRIVTEAKRNTTEEGSLRDRVSNIVSKHNISHIITHIERHPELLNEFKIDFATRTLQCVRSNSPKLIELSLAVIDHLSENSNQVLDVFLLPHRYKKELLHFNLCMKTLQDMKFTDAEQVGFMTVAKKVTSSSSILESISEITVTLLFNQLSTIIQIGDVHGLNGWYDGFRALRCHVPSRIQMIRCLQPTKWGVFDFMHCFFFLVLNFHLENNDVITILKQPQTIAALRKINVVLDGNIPQHPNKYMNNEVYNGLKELLPFVSWVLDEHCLETIGVAGLSKVQLRGLYVFREKARVYFLEDIVTYFLNDKEERYPADLPEDIESIVNLYLSFVDNKIMDINVIRIWNHIPFTWKIKTLQNWTREKPANWIKHVQITACAIISAVKPQPYTFTPTLLRLKPEHIAAIQMVVPIVHQPVQSTLEKVIYYMFSHDLEAPAQLHTLCTHYIDLNVHANGGEFVYNTILRMATAVRILQVAVYHLEEMVGKTAEDIMKGWPQNPVNVLETIREILQHPHLPLAPIYFLQNIREPKKLLEVLKSNDCLEMLALQNYKQVDSIVLRDMSCFPFLLENNSTLGKLYYYLEHIVDTKVAKDFKTLVGPAAQDENLRYNIRMCLVLICYKYFNELQKCDFVIQMLNDNAVVTALDINTVEARAYLFLSSGPLHTDHSLDAKYYFSVEARQKESNADLTMAHIMVNCLAVALGTPRNTNHLYERIFKPSSLNGTFCPGSDSSRGNYDCGFILTNNELTNSSNPPIMGNHRQFRLTLNTMTWAALTWCCLLDDQGNFQACINNTHFLNYWQPDTQVQENERIKRGLRARTPVERVRFYILMRAATFFHELCNDNDTIERQMSASHFLTESLMRLRELCVTRGHGALLSIFPDQNTAVQYENMMKTNVFDYVQVNYNRLKALFTNTQKSSKLWSALIEIQSYQSNFLVSPLFGKHILKNALVQVMYEQQKEIDAKKKQQQEMDELEIDEPAFEYEVLIKFYKELPSIKTIPYIPELVHMYQLLNELFGYRVTKEDANQSIRHCIKVIRNVESTSTIDNFLVMWDSFKKTWEYLRETLGELAPVCGRQDNFEQQIPEVTDETQLTLLVTETEDSINAILSLIGSLKAQANIIGVVDSNDSYNKKNFKGLLYKRGEEREDIEARLLPYRKDSESLLLGTVFTENEWYAAALAYVGVPDNEMEMIEREKITIDLSRIERLVLEQLNGKGLIDTKKLKVLFSMLSSQEEEPTNNTQTPNDASVSLEKQFGVSSMYHLAKSIRKESRFAKPLTTREEYTIKMYLQDKNNSDQDIFTLAQAMSQIILYVRTSYEKGNSTISELEDADKVTIEGVGQQILLTVRDTRLFKQFRNYSLSKLKELCLLVAQLYWERHQLWQNVPKDLQVELDKKSSGLLAEIKLKLINLSSAEMIENGMKAIQKLVDMLINETRIYNNLDNFLDKPLRDPYHQSLLEINIYFEPLIASGGLDAIFPYSIRTVNYATYLRWLHSICGELSVMLQKRRTEAMNLDEVYQEYIPSDIDDGSLEQAQTVVAPRDLALLQNEQTSSYSASNLYFVDMETQHGNADSDINLGEVGRIHQHTRGLKNLGNSCYMNSAIQCLAYLPSVLSFLQLQLLDDTQRQEPPDTSYLANIIRELWAQGSINIPVEPKAIYHILSTKSSRYIQGYQCDAHECLYTILDDNCQIASPGLSRMFWGKLRQTIQCINWKNCKQPASQIEHPLDLSLNLKDESLELTDLISDYFIKEQVTDRSCERCKCHIAEKYYKISQLPQVLVIHLKRFFENGYAGYSKNSQSVTYPLVLDLKPFLEPTIQDETTYKLISVCYHDGSLLAGHYYSYAVHEDKWYQANDSSVFGSPIETEKSSTVYILFYEKQLPKLQQSDSSPIQSSHIKTECLDVKVIFPDGTEDIMPGYCITTKLPTFFADIIIFFPNKQLQSDITLCTKDDSGELVPLVLNPEKTLGDSLIYKDKIIYIQPLFPPKHQPSEESQQEKCVRLVYNELVEENYVIIPGTTLSLLTTDIQEIFDIPKEIQLILQPLDGLPADTKIINLVVDEIIVKEKKFDVIVVFPDNSVEEFAGKQSIYKLSSIIEDIRIKFANDKQLPPQFTLYVKNNSKEFIPLHPDQTLGEVLIYEDKSLYIPESLSVTHEGRIWYPDNNVKIKQIREYLGIQLGLNLSKIQLAYKRNKQLIRIPLSLDSMTPQLFETKSFSLCIINDSVDTMNPSSHSEIHVLHSWNLGLKGSYWYIH